MLQARSCPGMESKQMLSACGLYRQRQFGRGVWALHCAPVSRTWLCCCWRMGRRAVTAQRCCFQNEKNSPKGGIRWQGPFTLIGWRRRWTGVGVLSGKCSSCKFWIALRSKWEGRCVSDIYPAEIWDAPRWFCSVDPLDLSLQHSHQSSHQVHTCEMRLVAMDTFIVFGNCHHTYIIKKVRHKPA